MMPVLGCMLICVAGSYIVLLERVNVIRIAPSKRKASLMYLAIAGGVFLTFVITQVPVNIDSRIRCCVCQTIEMTATTSGNSY